MPLSVWETEILPEGDFSLAMATEGLIQLISLSKVPYRYRIKFKSQTDLGPTYSSPRQFPDGLIRSFRLSLNQLPAFGRFVRSQKSPSEYVDVKR